MTDGNGSTGTCSDPVTGSSWRVLIRTPAGTAEHRLNGAPCTIGRDKDCDIRIDGDDLAPRHLELVANRESVAFRNLDGTRPVLLGNEAVRMGALRAGESLRIGELELALEPEQPANANGHSNGHGQGNGHSTALHPSAPTRERIQSLEAIASALCSSNSRDASSRRALEIVCRETGAAAATIAGFDSRGRPLVLASTVSDGGVSQAEFLQARTANEPFTSDDGHWLILPIFGSDRGVLALSHHADLGPSPTGAALLPRPTSGTSADTAFDLRLATAVAKIAWAHVEMAFENARLNDEVSRLRFAQNPANTAILASARIQPLRQKLRTTAGSWLPVCLLGESGTEKQDLAHYLHAQSDSPGPFVTMHPAVVSYHHATEALRNAIQDATQPNADGTPQPGTLYIDQPELLPEAAQRQLIQELHRTDSTGEGVAFRLVCGTTRPLSDEVKSGRLIADVADTLNGNRLAVPPLRSHPTDVSSLAELILSELGVNPERKPRTLTEGARQALLNYEWPDNVRELRTVLETAVAKAGSKPIAPRHLPPEIRAAGESGGQPVLPLREIERRHILDVLDALGWSKRKASKALGIAPSTLYEKLSRYDIHP